jgi:hypothetical protein
MARENLSRTGALLANSTCMRTAVRVKICEVIPELTRASHAGDTLGAARAPRGGWREIFKATRELRC